MDIFLVTFLLGLVVCLLIYLLRTNEDKNSSIPFVTYKYWPILGHIIPFARDRTTFLLECKKLYGQCFRIRLINRDFILILSPPDWSTVLRNSSFYFPVDVHGKNLFDIHTRFQDYPEFTSEIHRQFTKYLKNRDGLRGLVVEFVRRLRDQIFNEKMKAKDPTEWRTIGLLELSYQLIFEPSSLALFGEIDPLSIKNDFHVFDENLHHFASGFPRWFNSLFLSKSIQARQRLIERILENERPNRQSEFIHTRRQHFEQHDQYFPRRDIGGSEAGLYWGSLGNTIPGVFWALFYILQDENAVKTIREEIDKNLPDVSLDNESIADEWTMERLNACVYLESAINEMLRLVSAPFMTRNCDKDMPIVLQDGRSFVVKSNETVAFFSPVTHFDENLFPQPNQFMFDRFLNKTVDIIPGYVPFGGGKSMCPGRFFAKNEIKICLAFLLRYFDYEFIDKNIVPKQKAQRVGFGVAPPLTDIRINYRFKS